MTLREALGRPARALHWRFVGAGRRVRWLHGSITPDRIWNHARIVPAKYLMRFWRWLHVVVVGDPDLVSVRARKSDFQAAEYAAWRDRVSSVVSPARAVTAADRARARLAKSDRITDWLERQRRKQA